MSHDLKIPTSKAFDELHADNPLIKLQADEKAFLYSAISIYAFTQKHAEVDGQVMDSLDQITELLREAIEIGKRLEREIFKGPYADIIIQFAPGFQNLPRPLIDFSTLLRDSLEQFGKQGFKGRNMRDQILLWASEFVQLKVGGYHDHHLAHLIQIVMNEPEKERGVTGESIRKKRMYMSKQYPELYEEARTRARIAAESV